jgi:hypothetical protein
MEWIFFAAFAVLAAILFNYAQPKIMATSWAQKPGAATYAGKTAITAIGLFVVLIVAAFAMTVVTGKKEVIP